MILPKIALISLRGVEGCGISSWTRHFMAYYEKIGAECKAYALNTRVGRPETSGDLQITIFSVEEYKLIAQEINAKYDMAFIMSVPAIKKHSDASAYTYTLFLEMLKIKKVMINHDHHFMSIKRNAKFAEAIEMCDVLCAHSLNPQPRKGFMKWLEKNNVKPSKLVKLETFIEPTCYNSLINIDHQGRKKRVVNFGRAVAWKRILLLLNIANQLMDRGFVVELLGFERSIAGWAQINLYADKLKFVSTEDMLSTGINSCFVKYIPDKFSPLQKTQHNNLWVEYLETDLPYLPTDKVYCIASVGHYVGAKVVAASAFATHLRSFQEMGLCYGNNQEYQGLEAMLLSIPIYHKHFLETCTLPGSNVNLKEIDSFIGIDDDQRIHNKGGYQAINPEMFIDNLERIWNDANLYKKMRIQNVEILKKYYSAEVLVPSFLEKLG